MPKKARSSIGQKYKRTKREIQMSSGSQENVENSSDENVNNTPVGDQIGSSSVEISGVVEDVNQPAPSGLNRNRIDIEVEEASIMVENEADIALISFENNLKRCNKREQQSARAFQKLGIESDYEWPAENESKDDTYVRKLRNNNRYSAAKMRKWRATENVELRNQRQQAHAEDQHRYRNPENEALRQERLESHALLMRNVRLTGQIQRSREKPVQRQERVQRGLDERNENRRANKKACKASDILCGNTIVEEQNVGSFKTCTGAYENQR